MRRSRLAQLVAEGHATAQAVKAAIGRVDACVAACQPGITMAWLALDGRRVEAVRLLPAPSVLPPPPAPDHA